MSDFRVDMILVVFGDILYFSLYFLGGRDTDIAAPGGGVELSQDCIKKTGRLVSVNIASTESRIRFERATEVSLRGKRNFRSVRRARLACYFGEFVMCYAGQINLAPVEMITDG